MIGIGYDFSSRFIDKNAVQEAGALFVARYLDGGSRLTAEEAAEWHSRGIGVLPIYEHGNRDADSPWLAPQYAQDADRICDNLGIPLNVPIVHCDDFNDPVDLEPEFFRLCALNSKRPVMSYGSLQLWNVVRNLGVQYGWIVGTWGPGAPERGDGRGLAYEPDVHLVQIANYHTIPNTDDNIIIKPFPTWGGNTGTGDDMPTEDQLYNYLFVDKPFGRTRFDVAIEQSPTLATWLQDQASNVIKAVNKHVDEKLKALPTGGSATVDVAAIAEAVADELARRAQA